MLNKIKTILDKIQDSRGCHQREVKVLKKLYQETNMEDMFACIQVCVQKVFLEAETSRNKNDYMERIFDFLAMFIEDVTPLDSESDSQSSAFLSLIVKDLLKYFTVTYLEVRYGACLFMNFILKHLGNEKTLDCDLCDMIQEALLKCVEMDIQKIRLQAVLALVRLQNPGNSDCPVIKAYLSLFVDPYSQIRVEIVKSIAPISVTLPEIVNRLWDTEPSVRLAAFRRCGDLGINSFKIVDRRKILNAGLCESHSKVKNVFTEHLLQKWLHFTEDNIMKFLYYIRLDADENDINMTEDIGKQVIKILLGSTPVKDLFSTLPLNDEKLIPTNVLTVESAILWNILVQYFRKQNDDDYLEQIIPELTPFCNNIERFIIEKNKQKNDVEDWVFLTNQCILYNLFEIVEGYDLADEVGRRNLFILTEKLLKEGQLQFKLKKKIVELAYKATTSKEDFTSIICHLISEIREPFEQQEVEIDDETKAKKHFEKAQLRVKIIRLNVALENATETQNFLEADSISRQINELELKHKELSDETNRFEMVKVYKNDTKTICDCLDILVCLLELASTKTITPSLRSVKDEFVVPLLTTKIPEINWRVIRVLVLFCLLEEALLDEYIKICCIPIITYRTLLQYDKNALKVSIKGVGDFVRLYGTTVFSSMAESNISSVSLSQKRRLYNSEYSDESIRAISTFSFNDFLEILADILDDEDEEIRNVSVLCIAKLTLNDVFVSNTFITRLILKWCNPATRGLEVQQLLGIIISNFATKDNNKEIIGKSVIPIFEQIVGAPLNSPLKGIDCEKLIQYLTLHTYSKTILTPNNNPNVQHLHLNMAQMFIIEMSKKKNAKIAPYLCKMLTLLDIDTSNYVALKEMKALIETIINDNMLDRKSLKNLSIFKYTVSKLLEKSGNDLETILEENENSVNDTGNNENLNTDASNTGNEELFSQTPSTSTKKRRRERNSESENKSINITIQTSKNSQPSKKTKHALTNNTLNNSTIDQETKINTSINKDLDNPTKTGNKNLIVILDSQVIRLPNKSNAISEKARTETVNEKNINKELEDSNSSIDIISATTSEQSKSPSKRDSSDENSNESPPQSSSEITNSKQKKPNRLRKRKRNKKSSRSSSANSSVSESSRILKRPNLEETSQINSEKENRKEQHKKIDKNIQKVKNVSEKGKENNNNTSLLFQQNQQKKRRSRRLLSTSSDSNEELIINYERGTKESNEEKSKNEEGSKQKLTRNGNKTVAKCKAIENVKKKRYSNEPSNSSIDTVSATPSEQSKSPSKKNSSDENINSNNVSEKGKKNNNNTSIPSNKQKKLKNSRLFSSSSDSNKKPIINNKTNTKENNKKKSKNAEGSKRRLTRNGNKTVEAGKATENVQKKRYSNDIERSNFSIDIVSATSSEQSKTSSKRNSSEENSNSNNASEKEKENINNTSLLSQQNQQKKRRNRRHLSNSSDSNEELIINYERGTKESNEEKSKNAEGSKQRLTRNGSKTVEKGKATENVKKKRYSNDFERSNSSIDIVSATPSPHSKSSKRNSSDENISLNNGMSSRLHGSVRRIRSSKVDFNETTLYTIIHDESLNLSVISNSSFESQISEHNSTYSTRSKSSNARSLRSLSKKKNIE